MSVARGLERLGDPAGKTELDWVDAMRARPQSISVMPNKMRLLQWRSGRYQIQRVSVLFDPAGRFVRITSRYQC